MKYSLGISNLLEEIPSVSHSISFLYFFAVITEESFLLSPWDSFELWIQMSIFPFLLCLSVLLFSQLFFSSNFITRHHLINHAREVHRGTEIQRRNDSFIQVIKKSAWWSCLSIGPAEKDKISPIIECQGRLFRLREYGHGLMDMRVCSRIVQLFN